jgi:hypothetical protein
MGGEGYIITKDGDTTYGRISWRMKYVENNPSEIKFTTDNGSQEIYNAAAVSGLVIYPQTDFEGYEVPAQEYISLPSVKKQVPVFYNRLINGKLQVYHNRSSTIITKETAAVSTEFDGIEFRYSKETGLTVGPTFKTSYHVIERNTRFSSYYVLWEAEEIQKIDKDTYESFFDTLFGDCMEIQRELEINPGLRNFKNFMILAEVYNQLCR